LRSRWFGFSNYSGSIGVRKLGAKGADGELKGREEGKRRIGNSGTLELGGACVVFELRACVSRELLVGREFVSPGSREAICPGPEA